MSTEKEKNQSNPYDEESTFAESIHEELERLKAGETEDSLWELIELLYFDCMNPSRDPRSKFYHDEYQYDYELTNKLKFLLKQVEKVLPRFCELLEQRETVTTLSELELFEQAFEYGVCYARGNLEERFFRKRTDEPQTEDEGES